MSRLPGRLGLSPSVVLFSCLFAAQAAILVLSPILPDVAAEFGVSTTAAAQLRSVSGFTAGITALILAVTGDRYHLTRLLSVGLIGLAVGSLASAVSPGFAILLGAQVMIGFGLALVVSGGLAASQAWAASGESARVLSWALVGQPVAWIVGQPLAGAVGGFDWRWAWMAVPLASSLVAWVVVLFRDRKSSDRSQECDPLGLWRIPGVRSWAVGELCAYSAWAGTLVYAGAFFIETYGVTVGITGVILGAAAAVYVPGNFLGRKWLSRGASPLLLGFGLAVAVTAAMFGQLQNGVVFSTVLFGLMAFFAAGRTIAGAALGLELAEGRRLAAMSLRTALLQFGYLIGASLGGAALTQWGYSGMGWVFAALFTVASLLYLPRVFAGEAGRHREAVRRLRRSGATTAIEDAG